MESTVTMSLTEYNNMIAEVIKFRTIKQIAQAEEGEFGYSAKTSEIIDAILDIKRKAK